MNKRDVQFSNSVVIEQISVFYKKHIVQKKRKGFGKTNGVGK